MFEQDNDGFIFPVTDIYIIVWSGRDAESGIWDNYPQLDYGYFTDADTASIKANELNRLYPGEYDEDAEEDEKFDYVAIHKAKEEQDV